MRNLTFKFLNRAALFPVLKEMIKSKEGRYVKVEPLFQDEISGVDTFKLLALPTYDTLTMKVKVERNKAF